VKHARDSGCPVNRFEQRGETGAILGSLPTGLSSYAFKARDRAAVENGAPWFQMRQRCFGNREVAVDVGTERQIQSSSERSSPGGRIIDQDVELAEPLYRLVNCLLANLRPKIDPDSTFKHDYWSGVHVSGTIRGVF
jgi:hypothetical protein